MLTPYIESTIGLGLFLDKKGNAIYFQHGGGNEGFRCMLMAHKEKGYGAAIMVNSDNGQIINEILRSIAGEYQWENFLPPPHEIVTVPAQQLAANVGRYLVNPDRVLAVTVENGKLFAQPTQSPKIEFFPITSNKFIRKDNTTQYSFLPNASGTVDTVLIRFDGGESRAPRLANGVMIPYDYLLAEKFEEAAAAYRRIKQNQPDNIAVSENRLNGLGYELLNQQKFPAAIAVFKVNVEFYLQSANTYDSLGEAYMLGGNKELAIKNYQKSLELNPQNQGAVQMLKKLGQIK